MNNGRLFINGERHFHSFSPSESTASLVLSRDTFISHQSSDRATAERVAISLSNQGYPCYVDTLDPDVDGDSPQLESYLRQVIGQCRGLMAIVSSATKDSWWVPLEIGVALEQKKHIATYLVTSEDLPSYLWQWPMLRSDRDAISWAQDTHSYSVTRMNENWRSRTRFQQRSYT